MPHRNQPKPSAHAHTVQISDMARITTQELHSKIEQLEKSNELEHGHLSDRVYDLKDTMQENKIFFTNAIESLDKKVWALVLYISVSKQL